MSTETEIEKRLADARELVEEKRAAFEAVRTECAAVCEKADESEAAAWYSWRIAEDAYCAARRTRDEFRALLD